MKGEKITLKQILFLQLAVGIYSISGVMNRFAALSAFPSFEFIFFYGASIGVLVIYTFFWQYILRNVSLTTAYTNRPLSMLWGMMWGVVIFHETVTWNMLLGAGIILTGVIWAGRKD